MAHSGTTTFYEDILLKIGTFGKFQKLTFAALTFVNITIAFNTLGYVFWAARPDHWCDVSNPPPPGNISEEQWKKLTIPYDEDTNTFSTCSRYALNESVSYIDGVAESGGGNASGRIVEDCRSWTYDRSQYKSSIVTRFDLVCDRFWLRSISQSAYMAGYGVGLFIFGAIADRYGRRKALLLCAPMEIVTGIAVCFSVNIAMFIALRFVQAVFSIGLYMIAYVLLMELVGQDKRVLVAQLHMSVCGAAYACVPAIAYVIRDALQLQLVLVLPTFVFATYFWTVHESPRWLLSTGKTDEFCDLVRKIAKVNGNEASGDICVKEYETLLKTGGSSESSQGEACTSIFTNMYSLVFTLVQLLMWFTVAAVYFGLSLSATSLSGSDYLNTFLTTAVEVPAYLLVLPINTRVGRKPCVFACFLLCGLALGTTSFISKEWTITILLATNAGKFFVTMLFSLVYLYASELYATSVRAKGMSFCSVSARVGSIVSPFAAELTVLYPGLPQLIFGLMCLCSALATLLLPETRGKPLPQTSQEIRHLSRSLCWVKCCSSEESHVISKNTNATTESVDTKV